MLLISLQIVCGIGCAGNERITEHTKNILSLRDLYATFNAKSKAEYKGYDVSHLQLSNLETILFFTRNNGELNKLLSML